MSYLIFLYSLFANQRFKYKFSFSRDKNQYKKEVSE